MAISFSSSPSPFPSPLSPCLPVSLSPSLPLSLSPSLFSIKRNTADNTFLCFSLPPPFSLFSTYWRGMASIDRYRPPPREGYQPPVLPPTAANRSDRERDRPSKSPSAKKREVPPAAPSPPTHTSRTSPPRPQSRRSAPSPASSAPKSPVAMTSQWFFTSDEVLSSPSILDGLSPTEERLRRAKGVNFIYQAGVLLELPQTTLYVAGVFFHRFYMRCSMVEEKHGIHHYVSLIRNLVPAQLSATPFILSMLLFL